MNEKEIIRLLRDRDEHGIEELLKHYTPLIRYIIAPILPDAQDQEECISEIAMRVWEKIDQFDSERGNWNAWLSALTRNAALNRVRKKRVSEVSEEELHACPSVSPTPEEEILQKERRQMIRQAIDSLKSSERLLFYRKYYYMQSTAQIASELGLTERSVEGKLYRIRMRLRRLLGGEWHE